MDGVDEEKRATLKRFAAVGAVSPLARLSGDTGTSDARDAILGYLSTTSGWEPARHSIISSGWSAPERSSLSRTATTAAIFRPTGSPRSSSVLSAICAVRLPVE